MHPGYFVNAKERDKAASGPAHLQNRCANIGRSRFQVSGLLGYVATNLSSVYDHVSSTYHPGIVHLSSIDHPSINFMVANRP